MTKADIILKSIGYLVSLLSQLIAESPDKDGARKMIAARLRIQLERNALLEAVQAEDQAILDARIPQ